MKIGIVGLGLIGGSILKSLAQKGFEMFAVSRNLQTLESAKTVCNSVSTDLQILKDCEIVFVAVPMSNVLETLEKLEAILPQNTVVTDVSSLKEFVMQRKYSFDFIGSHPMAGTEHAGYKYSFAELFEDAKWVLTPYADTKQDSINKLESVILQTGAKVVFADAEKHDEAVAKISHMPMLLAQALFDFVKDDKLALVLAASGFRDMTRLAMSNVDMACDMIDMNRQNIEKALALVDSSVKNLNENYRQKIEDIKVQRSNMYNENGKNVVQITQ